MESRSNYRILIDLSNYYDDARRLSCVFTDEKTISHIIHLKQRIAKVFKIPGEFYLVAGQEVYLPLNEDIRIIKENEIIQVVPGSGVEGFLLWKDFSVKHDGIPLEALPVKQSTENINLRIDNNQEAKLIEQQKNSLQIVENLKINLQQLSNDNNKKEKNNDSFTKTNGAVISQENSPQTSTPHLKQNKSIEKISRKVSISVIEDESGSGNCSSESDQSIVNNQNENSSLSMPRRKRKRIRKRKAKKTVEQITNNSVKQFSESYFKPVFANDSKPKHMKFNWDDNTNEQQNKIDYDTSSLATLLNLKNTPVPVIFEGKKSINCDKLKIEKCENIHGYDNNSIKENNKILENKNKKTLDKQDFSKINPQEYPIYKAEFLASDVIAFRVFKLESNYTPGVSGNIIGKILHVNPTDKIYKLSIITGGDQLKEPEGKFSLNQNEDEAMDEENKSSSNIPEIIEKRWEELIEPRLIFRGEA